MYKLNLTNNSNNQLQRPITTLFMLISVDGKISTGSSDELDVDKDFPKIDGVKEGLHQYYEIEKTTDLWSLCTGKVQGKISVNEKAFPKKSDVSFVIVDNKHLTEHGIRYFCELSQQFVLITTNLAHPAFNITEDNLHIILQDTLNLNEVLAILKNKYGCQRLTIQSGGTINSIFLREKLFNYIDIVVAPILIGGKDTSSLIDGKSITSSNNLNLLGVLRLENCEVLKNSYLRLKYKSVN